MRNISFISIIVHYSLVISGYSEIPRSKSLSLSSLKPVLFEESESYDSPRQLNSLDFVNNVNAVNEKAYCMDETECLAALGR